MSDYKKFSNKKFWFFSRTKPKGTHNKKDDSPSPKNTDNNLILLVPRRGVEPPTYWLRISCSTNWAISALLEIILRHPDVTYMTLLDHLHPAQTRHAFGVTSLFGRSPGKRLLIVCYSRLTQLSYLGIYFVEYPSQATSLWHNPADHPWSAFAGQTIINRLLFPAHLSYRGINLIL